MNPFILRGTSGPGDEPSDEHPLSHFSTDMRWEIGYDARRFTFYARLIDDDHEVDPVLQAERQEAVFEVGTEPYGCPTLEVLELELAATTMQLPSHVAAGLRAAQRSHLTGELDDSPEDVAQRWRAVRHAVLIRFLTCRIRPTMQCQQPR